MIRKDTNELVERQPTFIKIDTKSFMDLCQKVETLESELKDIKQMSMWEFADKYCNDTELEDAGKAFARSLGVGMSSEEVAIEQAENCYIPYDGDDF